MHGNNLNSLHQLIHPEILPSELGGMMPPYDMGTWARTLLDHAYDEETDYCPESYTLSVQDLERDLEKNMSPKTMKRSELVLWLQSSPGPGPSPLTLMVSPCVCRSQSVVEPGVLKRADKVKSEEDNLQPLLSLDWTPQQRLELRPESIFTHTNTLIHVGAENTFLPRLPLVPPI